MTTADAGHAFVKHSSFSKASSDEDCFGLVLPHLVCQPPLLYIYIYIYIYLSLSLSLSLYTIYIYIYIYICPNSVQLGGSAPPFSWSQSALVPRTSPHSCTHGWQVARADDPIRIASLSFRAEAACVLPIVQTRALRPHGGFEYIGLA